MYQSQDALNIRVFDDTIVDVIQCSFGLLLLCGSDYVWNSKWGVETLDNQFGVNVA